jgi:hypothetical protein
MSKILSLTVLFLSVNSVFSQGIDNLWLMGYANNVGPPWGGSKIDFSSGSPIYSNESRLINLNCTNGLISNSAGNLLFLTNGAYIQNAVNDTMLNGSGLNPGVFTTMKASSGLTIPQANLVIPFPNDINKYYLFHETSDDYGNTYCTLHLYYSVIDMVLDSGLGGVVQKNTILLSDSLVGGRLTACKHANGRDWWVIAHQFRSDLYFKYLISPDGIQGPFYQNIGVERGIGFGQCLFSPDGKLFAYYAPTSGDLDLFDFDRCTGDFTLKSHVDINDSAAAGGVAFSPNSSVIYLSSMNYVYQLDLTSTDIPASILTVATYDGFYSPQPPLATVFYLSQLAPDNKIYINCGNSTLDIHVINYPDSLGLACDVCQHCIPLPAYNAFTIPNYPNYFLGVDSGSVCDTLNIGVPIISSIQNLNIFPNPVREKLYITQNNFDRIIKVSISNSLGQVLNNFSTSSINNGEYMEVNTGMLTSGLYFLELQNGEQKVVKKFVKE